MWFSALSLLFCSQVALGGLIQRATPIPPSDDPFYLPPAGYENAEPGTILRSRPAPAHIQVLSTVPVNIKEVTQLLYRTNNALGEPEVTVTTVLVPNNADYGKVVNYQTGSKSKYAGTGDVEVLLILGALNQGWIVNTPDWEGPNSTFIEGFQAGQATLDSVRAVLSSTNITGVQSDAKVALWGYSGGALASEWALEIQSKYAPELKDFVGAALGGTTPNIVNFCSDGVSITYVRDAFGEHFTQAATSFPDVINYLTDRFNGVPISGCTTRDAFTDLLDPGAPSTFGKIVVQELLNVLQVPVGPGNV